MKKWNIVYHILIVLIPVLLLTIGIFWNPLFYFDSVLCDSLHRQTNGVMPDIKIIGVDEETLEAYGSFESWSREKTADLVDLLYQDEKHSPAMIGLDFLFTGNGDAETDKILAEACKKPPLVVMSSNLVYQGIVMQNADGKRYWDDWNVAMVEKPYEILDSVIENGFTNAYISKDGIVRYTKLFENYKGEQLESFDWKLYSAYEEREGREPKIPRCTADGRMLFFYSGGIGEFPHFSMKRVLDGEVPLSEFEDCIVLVGAYAPGSQDAYGTSVQRSKMMYGVEIHANVIQALMDHKTAIPLSKGVYLLITTCLIAVFFLFGKKEKLFYILLEGVGLIIAHLLWGRILSFHGYTIRQIYFIIVILLGIFYFIVSKYLAEILRKHKLLAMFKTYVAPQIVDVLSKDDQIVTRLGGEKRKVAILFVDIRGFTSMSEGLSPETVVQILNEYLAMTTKCIFNNKGTLDKFIGDSTMAVFNAPVDLPNYVSAAVQTALDMKKEAENLSAKIQKLYGRSVSFGIGIHCGEAIIGNIGCQVRMDYTAIGDTVNTASRLESKAEKGEILISEEVYEYVKNQVETEFVEEMELKGKTNTVNVYRVLKEKELLKNG